MNTEIRKNYDIIIIGGGPAGLALAQCCSKVNKKILIIEKEPELGGCHAVRRVDVNGEKLFTEHGPRVYSKTYHTFIDLLKDMNLKFDDLFVPYKFNITNIGGETVLKVLSFKELVILGKELILLLINTSHGKDITVKQFVDNKNFSNKSKDILDRICRLTDGASSDKYTLNEFLQLVNVQFVYGLYQPNEANDKKLLKLWSNYLINRKVDILTNAKVNKLYGNNNKITEIEIINKNKGGIREKITGKTIVCAIPPKNLVSLLKISDTESIKNSFGKYTDIEKYSKDTAYIEYICITFHWKDKLNLPKIYGFPKSEWGIAYIVMSDYIDFEETQSKTMISLAITITDRKSSRLNKTANECNKEELFKEVFMQLRESFPDIKRADVEILSPEVYYSNEEKKWLNEETAFIASAGFDWMKFKSGNISNLYTVGTHTGKHKYPFTSLESAVSNAVALSNELYPETIKYHQIKKGVTLRDVLIYIILILIIITLLMIYKKR